MKILCVSGSVRSTSSNQRLLRAVDTHFNLGARHYSTIKELPLFDPELDQAPWSTSVIEWRSAVREADALLISTPVYLFNIPAVLKNAMEWLTTSGELDGKRVLPITYTPNPPRGEKAMQSLLWSLTALNAQIVLQLPLYQIDLSINEENLLIGDESIEMLREAMEILRN